MRTSLVNGGAFFYIIICSPLRRAFHIAAAPTSTVWSCSKLPTATALLACSNSSGLHRRNPSALMHYINRYRLKNYSHIQHRSHRQNGTWRGNNFRVYLSASQCLAMTHRRRALVAAQRRPLAVCAATNKRAARWGCENVARCLVQLQGCVTPHAAGCWKTSQPVPQPVLKRVNTTPSQSLETSHSERPIARSTVTPSLATTCCLRALQ